MFGQKRQHMIKKTNASLDLCGAAAVEVHRELYVSFFGLAVYGGNSGHGIHELLRRFVAKVFIRDRPVCRDIVFSFRRFLRADFSCSGKYSTRNLGTGIKKRFLPHIW